MDDFVVNKTVAQLETTQFVNKMGMQCNYQQKCRQFYSYSKKAEEL